MSAPQLRRVPGMPWWSPVLVFVPIGAAAAMYGFLFGSQWRAVLTASPRDPTPGAGLFVVAVVGGLGIVLGLALTVSRWRHIGPSLFALGVGLTCGVLVGFVAGAG